MSSNVPRAACAARSPACAVVDPGKRPSTVSWVPYAALRIGTPAEERTTTVADPGSGATGARRPDRAAVSSVADPNAALPTDSVLRQTDRRPARRELQNTSRPSGPTSRADGSRSSLPPAPGGTVPIGSQSVTAGSSVRL